MTSNPSKVVTPAEPADLGRPDGLEDLNINRVSVRVSVSSENERFTEAGQGPSLTQPTHFGLAPGIAPQVPSSATSELLKTPKDVEEEGPTTPQPCPPPSLTPVHQAQTAPKPWSAHSAQMPTPDSAPVKTKPKTPLSLWERNKLEATTQPVPASSLFNDGGAMNSSGVWGEAGGGVLQGTPIRSLLPTLARDRQSILTDRARDRRRKTQRESLVDGFLGSSPTRRNNLGQSQITAKPVTALP